MAIIGIKIIHRISSFTLTCIYLYILTHPIKYHKQEKKRDFQNLNQLPVLHFFRSVIRKKWTVLIGIFARILDRCVCNLMKYDTACPLKVVNRYNVDILLYLSIGISSLNRIYLQEFIDRNFFTESNGIIFIYIACTERKI